MIPNPGYFPTSLGARADWFANFNSQFTIVGPSLGFTPAEIEAVSDDNDVMQFLRTASSQTKAIMAASKQFRKVITEGKIGDPTPTWPVQFSGVPPIPLPATGIFERLDNLVKRIRVAPKYTTEVGALLGIIPAKSDSISPADFKPQPSLYAEPGNVVFVKFSRGQTDGIDVDIQVDNSGKWINQGKFLKSPAGLVIPENPDGLPRSVQVRSRHIIGDQPVGQFSDVDVISTIP